MKKSDYIILEGKVHGINEYPDLLIPKYRLGLDKEVEVAGKSLGLNLKNTAKELNGKEYIGEINQNNALDLIIELKGLTLNIKQFKDYLNLLKNGNKVYDGRGKLASSMECLNLFNEITEKRNPWRGEYLNARFEQKNDGLYSLSKYLKENKEIKLNNYLKSDKCPGISLDDWLSSNESHGLPKSDIQNGDLYYFSPRDKSIARFYADSDWVSLICNWDPSDSGPALGVRRAKILR